MQFSVSYSSVDHAVPWFVQFSSSGSSVVRVVQWLNCSVVHTVERFNGSSSSVVYAV